MAFSRPKCCLHVIQEFISGLFQNLPHIRLGAQLPGQCFYSRDLMSVVNPACTSWDFAWSVNFSSIWDVSNFCPGGGLGMISLPPVSRLIDPKPVEGFGINELKVHGKSDLASDANSCKAFGILGANISPIHYWWSSPVPEGGVLLPFFLFASVCLFLLAKREDRIGGKWLARIWHFCLYLFIIFVPIWKQPIPRRVVTDWFFDTKKWLS